MKLKVTLDRVENNRAVLLSEDMQQTYIISRGLLPKEVKEGDVLVVSVDTDKETTRRRREETSGLIDKLSKKGQNKSL